MIAEILFGAWAAGALATLAAVLRAQPLVHQVAKRRWFADVILALATVAWPVTVGKWLRRRAQTHRSSQLFRARRDKSAAN